MRKQESCSKLYSQGSFFLEAEPKHTLQSFLVFVLRSNAYLNTIELPIIPQNTVFTNGIVTCNLEIAHGHFSLVT